MKRENYQKKLIERVGHLQLSENEKKLLEEDRSFKDEFEFLSNLERHLRGENQVSLEAEEFARVEQRLDHNITRYINRATTFYRVSGRLSMAAAAFLLIVFISVWSGFNGSYMTVISDGEVTTSETIVSTGTEQETLEDTYVEILLSDYVSNFGYNAVETLLGDITPEELDYLENYFQSGDIL
jgi:hypothetical protein